MRLTAHHFGARSLLDNVQQAVSSNLHLVQRNRYFSPVSFDQKVYVGHNYRSRAAEQDLKIPFRSSSGMLIIVLIHPDAISNSPGATSEKLAEKRK